MEEIPVITIDGLSGSGKGTISKMLCLELGWNILDSGALYRTLAYLIEQRAIVVEDFAATLGLGIALFGSIFANITGNPIYDAISSIMIGILLMVSGLFLGYEMKHLITGETVNQQTKDGLTELIKKTDSIKSIESLRIVSIGANSYLALCKVDYVDTTSDIEMVDVNNKIRDEISKNFKEITEIYFNPA